MLQDEFDSYPLWAALDSIENLIKSAPVEYRNQDVNAVARMVFVIGYVRSFKTVGAEYFARQMLENVIPHTNNITNYLSTWTSNGQPNLLGEAQNSADAIVYVLGQWPQSTARGGAAAKAASIATDLQKFYESAIEDTNSRLKAELTTLADGVDALHAQIAERDAALARLNTSITDSLARVQAAEDRLNSALTNQNDSFNTSQNQREDATKEWFKERTDELKNDTAGYLDKLNKNVETAKTVLTNIEKLQEETEKVASAATGALLARDHGKYSQREWWTGVIAYALGFTALVISAFFLFHALYGIGPSEHVSWQFITLKIGVALSITAASGVAFALGARQLRGSRAAKRVELELRAIGPFLADIEDPEEVEKAKLAFVDRTFGRPWEEARIKDKDQEASTTLAGIAENLGAIAKLFNSK